MSHPQMFAMIFGGSPVLDNVKTKAQWRATFDECPFAWGYDKNHKGDYSDWMDKMDLVEVFAK